VKFGPGWGRLEQCDACKGWAGAKLWETCEQMCPLCDAVREEAS
jgi:hypothetical protein